MTIGSRIARKRKEQGLSQEALGEQLGVSRQAIYKWESDAALPEIEKLIALSRLFGVSVGWLLGVEETAETADTVRPDTAEHGDLTETQLKMVEEIVARYLAAQPQPKKRRVWPFVLAGFALLIAVFSLISRLDEINQQYHRVQMTVSNVQSSVNSQISGISGRVEEILKAQNALTADYDTKLLAGDLARNTVTFSARAVPKTYEEGMSAVFVADSGDGPAEFPAELAPGQAFTGEITTELTDLITLSVVFISPDGIRQTQLLDTYDYLWSGTLPDNININGDLIFMDVVDGAITFTENRCIVSIWNTGSSISGSGSDILPAAKAVSTRVGLFRGQTLVTWLEPCPQPSTFHGFEGHDFYRLPENFSVTVAEEDLLSFSAFVTDEYGREFVVTETVCCISSDGDLTYSNRSWDYITSPDEWTY